MTVSHRSDDDTGLIVVQEHRPVIADAGSETFAYRFGDLPLVSDLRLNGVRPDPTATGSDGFRLRLTSEPAPTVDTHVFDWVGRYNTRLATTGEDWRIDSAFDGVFVVDRTLHDIRIHSAAEPPYAAMADVLVRRILPRLVTARGALTLHAAAVATHGTGLLLLGSSGAGKSTLTAALARTPGWDLLSDDLSMVWPHDPPIVAPGATGVCVWPASRDGLAIDPAHCTAMPGYDGKVRFDPPGAPSIAPVPLGAMVFLDRDASVERPALVPVNRAEALIQAARQLVLFNPAAPRREEYAGLLARLNLVIADMPVLRLRYPSRFSALPEVADLLAGLAQ